VSAPLDIAAASRSELGQRKSNEDKVRICREGARWVAVLADGAGGHRGGARPRGAPSTRSRPRSAPKMRSSAPPP